MQKPKPCAAVIAAIIFTVTFFAGTAAAAAEITVTLDGVPLSFDAPPQIVNGRTMVPMRAVFEAMGASVAWDGKTRTVSSVRDGTEIRLTVGSTAAYKNGTPLSLDAAPFIASDRTLVPIRFIAESFDAVVDWDGENRVVTINDDSSAAQSGVPPTSDMRQSELEALNPVDISGDAANLTIVCYGDRASTAENQLYEAEYTLSSMYGKTVEDKKQIGALMGCAADLLAGRQSVYPSKISTSDGVTITVSREGNDILIKAR